MKYILTIITTTLLFNCSFAQSPKGDSLRRAGDLEGAIVAYKSAFNISPQDDKNTYALTCAMALTYYQTDSAFKYLNLALVSSNSLWALVDNDLLSMTEDDRWSGIITKQMDKFQQENGSFTAIPILRFSFECPLRD